MDIITFLLTFISMVITFRIMHAIMSAKNDAVIEMKVQEGMKKLKETIIPSRIEEHNGVLYLYNAETEDFIAQGKDMEELNANAKLRFPDKLFNVPQEVLNKYMKGEVKANA